MKNVDIENEEGYFKVYKRFVFWLNDMIVVINFKYIYLLMFVSIIFEGILY